MAKLTTDGDVTNPPKLERFVDKLLKSKTFMPKASEKKRKSSAYDICSASTKNEADVGKILSDLPPYIQCDIDEDGSIQLSEVEDFDFEKFDEEEEKCGGACENCGTCSSDLHEPQIFFSDEETDESKEIFTSFTKVHLAEKSGSKKVMRQGPDGKDKEYTNVPMEMLREGVFRHGLFGDLEINRKMMTTLIQNFTNDILERELALDVSHEPDNGAYGWLRELKLKRREFGNKRGKRNVLIGTFDLNARGEELIREEIFKYFSIEYHRNYSEREKTEKEIAEDKKKTPQEKDEAFWNGTDKGKEYGPTMFGGALTNRPFIPSMKAVKMSEGATTTAEAEPVLSSSKPQKTTDEAGNAGAITKEEGGEDNAKNGKKADKNKSEMTDQGKRDKSNEIINNASNPGAQEGKLPDAAFALVKRDRSGKVIKRSLPHHGPGVNFSSEDSSVDKGRLRNALARWNQVEGFSAEEKARAKQHLEYHERRMLKKKTRASEGGAMFETRIAELKDQLDGMQDQNSELAQNLRDQIAFMEKAQADHEAKLAEQKSQAEKFETQLSEQQKLANDTATQLAELKKRDEEREARLAEITEKNRRNEIEMYCEGLATAKYPPAIVKAARNILVGEIQQHSEDDGSSIVKFTDKVNDKETEHKFSFRDAVEYLINSIPDTHKTDLETGIQHSQKNEPETVENSGSKVTLADGAEIDVMDPEAIARAVKGAGYKTEVEQ